VTRPPVFPAGYDGLRARDIVLSDGGRLRLVESGEMHAPPLLLVHGFGASSYQWRFQLSALAAAGFHVLAPDLPGHGFSQLTFPDGEYTRPAFARRIWQLLDALGVDRVPIVGQSMGGGIVAEMAWQQPDRPEGLVLMSAVGFGDVPNRAHGMHWVPDALAPLGRLFAAHAVARLILHNVYGSDARWTRHDEDELLAPYAQTGIYRALLRTIKEFDFSLHTPEQLVALPSGTLVIFGAQDGVVRAAALTERVRAMRDGQLVLLPRVGHLPQVEAAAEVARLLTNYLRTRRVAPAGTAH